MLNVESAAVAPPSSPNPAQPVYGAAVGGLPIVALAIAAVAVHLVTNLGLGGYGYFRDELYYIACSHHLAFGYVDQPSLSIILLWIELHLFGTSIFALRIFPALADGATVIVAAMLAREMGGGRFAMGATALAVLIAPVFLAVTSFYSMNAYDPLLWAVAGLVVVRILNTGDARLWLSFGLIAGIGLENKISMLFLCFGVVAGLILTARWRDLASPWLWLGGALATLLFLPYVIWNALHGFPTLEFMHNADLYKNIHPSLPAFAAGQLVLLNPIVAPLWIAGLGWCFFEKSGRYRLIGWIYVAVFALTFQGGKAYYAAPVYILLLAAGAIALERFSSARRWGVGLRSAEVVTLVIAGLISAPFAIPVLPPSLLASLAAHSSMQNSALVSERRPQGILPQTFADRFGWPEMAVATAQVYASLPPAERAHTAIFASNYGEAGAIDFFGPSYGLPPAISGHNNYWFWGFGNRDIDTVIALGGNQAILAKFCGEAIPAAKFRCRYCMRSENGLNILICRKPTVPIANAWPRLKHFD